MDIRTVPYEHADASRLIAAVQQELVTRYGEPDQNDVRPAEFDPPHGVFLVGYVAGDPAVCGGWRRCGHRADGAREVTDAAEVKRMYTAPWARGRGLARQLLAELENRTTRAGFTRVVLETGVHQPEALRLYAAAGYRDIAGFGYYRDDPESRFLGKELHV